jgi:hypothetical protein
MAVSAVAFRLLGAQSPTHDARLPVWIGTVEFDFETGLQHDPLDPSSMRQAIGGYWVHGFQKGEDPELWAPMFFEHRHAIVKR